MKKLMGYTAFNTKTKRFLNFDGREYNDQYEVWKNKADAQDILDEIDFVIENSNNQISRQLKKNRKYFKIVKLSLQIDI